MREVFQAEFAERYVGQAAAVAQLLEETDKVVAEVARACGGYNHSAFTCTFHSPTGLTPPGFRR